MACVNNIINDIIYMYLLNAATNFNNFRMDASGENDSIQQRPKSNNAWISILHLFLPTVRKHLKIYSQCKSPPDQAVMDLFLKQVLVPLSIPLVHSVKFFSLSSSIAPAILVCITEGVRYECRYCCVSVHKGH